MGEGVGEGTMLMYRCALIIKYCMGDVVATAPSGLINVAGESLKQCLMWVECLAWVQMSPLPQEKSGEESLLPIFSEEGGRLYTRY